MKKAGLIPAFRASRCGLAILGLDRLDTGLRTVNQFDQRHRGVVAIAKTVLQNVAPDVSWGNFCDYIGYLKHRLGRG